MTEMNLQAIGARLRTAREKIGLTIEKIHQETGFSKSLISEAENGIKKPSSRYLFALVERFKVNINYILTGKGDMFMSGWELTGDFGADKEKVIDLLYHIERIEMVRYEILGFFLRYKNENAHIIDRLLKD